MSRMESQCMELVRQVGARQAVLETRRIQQHMEEEDSKKAQTTMLEGYQSGPPLEEEKFMVDESDNASRSRTPSSTDDLRPSLACFLKITDDLKASAALWRTVTEGGERAGESGCCCSWHWPLTTRRRGAA